MVAGLPEPTVDIGQARTELETYGYCILRDALSPAAVAALRHRAVEQATGELVHGIGGIDRPDSANGSDTADTEQYYGGAGREPGTNRRVWTLINKGSVFHEILTHQPSLDLIAGMLGTPFLLSGMQANFVTPGDKPLPLHSDQGFIPRPWPPYAMTANVIWLLDAFTAENGATTVVPGTHSATTQTNSAVSMERARLMRKGGIPVCAPAGSALVFDGRLVHGTGVNTTDRERVALLTYFCRPFLRQQENFPLSVADDVLEELSDDVRALLGFGVWNTLGSVEGVGAEQSLVARPAKPVGALDRAGRPATASHADLHAER